MKERESSLWNTLGQKTKIIILGVIAAAIIIAVLLIVVFSPQGETKYDAAVSLREVIEVSDLSTAVYTYNSITEVRNEKETKYYVSYEGKVRAGFDISEIDIVQDGQHITIIVPPLTIHSVELDENSMDYIFLKKKYNTETTFAEAVNACKADLQAKAEKNNTFIATAKDGAKEIISALTKPFLSEITMDIQFADEITDTNTQEETVQ